MKIEQLDKERIPELRNIPVYTADGDQIGHVGDVYYNDGDERVECVAVAGDAVGFSKRVIPVAGAELDDGRLRLPYGRGDIEESPEFDEADEDGYADVRRHYEERGGASVVRSEEELAVGKRAVEAGQVRLRKWVETEPVEMDVELKREVARVEREPIDQPAPGAELGDQEVAVPLHEEEAVVQKQTVAKERVGVTTDVETEKQRVRDEVRKERVDVDDKTR